MKPFYIIPFLALLAACEVSQIQDSSGAAFVAASAGKIDSDIAQAAAGEPALRFPARIGVTRVDARQVVQISTEEREAIQTLVKTSDALGEFTFVSDFGSSQNGRDAIHDARLHGAEQHLDYLIVYQTIQTSRGAAAKGRIEIAIVDVRSGYVYARATEEAGLGGFGSTRIAWRYFEPSDRGSAKLVKTALPDVAEILNALYARAN